MILVDTSIWIDHLRQHQDILADLLERGLVLGHPFVLGEIALGHLHRRETILNALRDLPQAIMARDPEVMEFLENHELMGKRLGYVDVHLLASARLSDAKLWSRDKRLAAASLHRDLAAHVLS